LQSEFVVDELSINVVTGDSPQDRNGQGFSATNAEAIITKNQETVAALSQLTNQIVKIRCANLIVSGNITNIVTQSGITKFTLSVTGVTYKKPQGVKIAYKNT